MTPRKIFSHLLLALPLFAGSALPTQMVYAQSAETAKQNQKKDLTADACCAMVILLWSWPFSKPVYRRFQVWSTLSGQPIAPQDLQLSVRLIRLGNVVDNIGFRAEGDYLRGDMEIYRAPFFLSIFRFSMLASNTSGVTTILRDVRKLPLRLPTPWESPLKSQGQPLCIFRPRMGQSDISTRH